MNTMVLLDDREEPSRCRYPLRTSCPDESPHSSGRPAPTARIPAAKPHTTDQANVSRKGQPP